MDLKNKKIGIWGFGVVGSSVLNYVTKLTNYVQVLDKKANEQIPVILQTTESLQKFLQENDYIIPSPGIPLHEYTAHHHKFICELDLFTKNYQGTIIAITGTAGKTTVTDFIAQSIPHAIAAGNIGFAMLDVLELNPQPRTIVLELSSYQLQYAHNFAPEIAIWTNFFPNHLDHHQNIDEYFQAKCNILKFQNKDQVTIIAHELVNDVLKFVDYQGNLYTYSTEKPVDLKNNLENSFATFYIENNNLILWQNNQITIIFENIDQLPQTTFMANWIIILATLYIQKKDLAVLNFSKLIPQPHRAELIGNYHNVKIYNDSKSTIWQSTKEALTLFPDKKTALIIGGMSKGTDRSPLFQYIAQQKNIVPFVFGKERETLSNLCEQYQIPYFTSEKLEDVLITFQQHHHDFDILLFSPAGSSFDQFKNYQDRGNIFKALIQKLKDL